MELTTKPEKKITVCVRLSPQTNAALEAAAKSKGRTRSSIVDECVSRVLAKAKSR